ncbi:MAG: CHASE2 domain-containing protein [Cyclobacteriaceae bacterium]
MLKKIWLDVIFASIFIFVLAFGISNAAALKVFDLFDPIGEAFEDMEFSDIVFSQLREAPIPDERIVLVNVAYESRGSIGTMLNIVNQYEPKVVGIDLQFLVPKDTLEDAVLEDAFANTEQLILPSKVLFDIEDRKEFDSLEHVIPRFLQHATDTAFVNLNSPGSMVQQDLKMCRDFLPQEVVGGKSQYAFGVKLAEYYDPEKAQQFLERGNTLEVINYRGNVFDYGTSEFGTLFYALDVNDVYQENFLPEVIKDKIVIFCYLGRYLGDRESLEDKYFTPVNKKYMGRTFPDMYGGVIHANIVSMILNEDYVNEMGETTSYLLAIILCLINVALFSIIYHKLPRWYDGITKLIQLAEIFLLVSLIIMIFHFYSYKLELIPSLAVIALAGDSLEVYYGVIKNAFTRERKKDMKEVNKL